MLMQQIMRIVLGKIGMMEMPLRFKKMLEQVQQILQQKHLHIMPQLRLSLPVGNKTLNITMAIQRAILQHLMCQQQKMDIT